MEVNRRELVAAPEGAAAPSFRAAPGYKLICLMTDWGFPGSLDQFCTRAKADGFDGTEIWVNHDPAQEAAKFATLKAHGLQYGALIGSQSSEFAEHLDIFKRQLEAATGASMRPLYINCHSGRDYFSAEQNQTFIDLTVAASKKSGIPIYHETHRSRILYSAPASRPILERNRDLRITFDVSHWCCVSESLLADQQDTLDLALARTGHIHARVGHAEGPQVSDPRAPEWAEATAAHVAWWDRIAAAKMRAGETMTMLSEFGPPPYQPTVPYTNVPVSDQWDINVHMMRLFRERYSGAA